MEISTPVGFRETRKTRKGWLGNKVRQVHLRNDIPCGLEFCTQHANPYTAFFSDSNVRKSLYLVDTATLIEQTDIVYNCEDLQNVVFLQSSLQKMKKNNLIKYNAFKNYLEAEAVGEPTQEQQQQIKQQQQNQQKARSFWVFADLYHKAIAEAVKNRLQLRENISDEQKQWIHLQSCAEWYQHHIDELKLSFQVKIITTNNTYIQQSRTEQRVQIVSLIKFLQQNNSNLLDFVGFTGIQTEMQGEPIFQEHLNVKQAQKKVKEGKLFQGKFMNEKSYFKIGKKMFKLNLKNNRAMFGDVVAIQISPIQQWDKKAIKQLSIEGQEEPLFVVKQEEQQQVQPNLQNGLSLFEILQQNPNLVPKGKVKSVIKRNIKQYCGSVDTQKLVQSGEGWQIFEFKPVDDKLPNFSIRTFNSDSIKNKRIQVAYDSWPTHSPRPLCHFVRIIGNAGDSRTQGDVILLQHNVQIKQFSRKAYECLPKAGSQFKIPKQQQAYRLDLRSIQVCSIDPPGCKDIDDALHCIMLPNGNLQIGVHIADVSYYVLPDSALDMQARNRCTTVYLVDRRTDMLPKLLTQNLCSLRANVDRLAFSTIWEMDRQANIINTTYCKSIIRSRRAFTYMEAQQLMDSDSTTSLAESIRNLNRIAKKLKQKRLNDGALTLASTQVKITMEEQTHSATDVQLYQLVQANYLIEEFMLLANIAVAQKIYSRFPSISILRRHTAPKAAELQILRQILALSNFQLHYQSSKALADSLDKIQKKGDPFFNKLIRILTTRCMNEATYFCSADFDPQQFYHYGLAAPFYTHFTSPIRRYADVLVHRLLAAAIDLHPLPDFMINKMKMSKVCQKMNLRNRMARYASRASSDYHTYQFFKNRQEQKQSGIITNINQQSITIMLIKYGLETKYQLSREQVSHTLRVNKEQGVFNKCYVEGKERDLFEHVDVKVRVEMHGFHKKVIVNIQ